MDLYERVTRLGKRRGFLYPSFEIYDGVSGFYDWGPLGATLLRNVVDLWREVYVTGEGFSEVMTPTVMPEEVFEASGHLDGFVDPMVECGECGEAFRADHLVESYVDVVADSLSNERLGEIIGEEGLGCPECGGPLGDVYDFNLMFDTTVGPGKGRQGYLRPETAQGIFVSYPRLHRYAREKLPFGVVQTGRAYRNEVSPRQGVVRLREFNQMEVEVFVDPEEKSHPGFEAVAHRNLNLLPEERQLEGEGAEHFSLREALEEDFLEHELFAYHLDLIDRYLRGLGIPDGDLRFRQHLPDERAHYAADCWDAEVHLERFGWVEAVGLADRTDYDLKKHAEHGEREMTGSRMLEEARRETRVDVDLDMSSLGPRLKGDAGAAAEAVKRRGRAGEELEGDLEVSVGGDSLEVREEEYEVSREEVEVSEEEFVPHVIEPSYGVDRIVYSVLEKAFRAEEVEERERRVLEFPPEVAPVKAQVLPLMEKEELMEAAREVRERLRGAGVVAEMDTSGNVGRRYRRGDEIGVPVAVTVDPEGLEGEPETVTLRDRDSMEQVRVPLDDVVERVEAFLKGEELEGLGEPV